MKTKRKLQVAIVISGKVELKTKSIIKEKQWYYIMIKRSIQEEDLTFINTYGPNIGTSKYIKQILTEENRKKGQQYNNNMEF